MEKIKDFHLDSFLRIIWVSEQAKNKWNSVIKAISSMVHDLEIDSVEYGHRKCAWRTLPLKTLPDFSKKCGEKNLIVTPVKLVGNWGNGFIHYTPSPDPKDPNPNVYCIISKNINDAMGFRMAHESGDHEKQGEYLGFPVCCRKFFSKEWAAGNFDPMYQSYMSGNCESHQYSIPIMRYIGLRIGFHIPCSFKCSDTISIANTRLSIAKDQELVKLLIAMLSMPMSWEIYKGIAIVRTPIFYIITQSIPTNKKYTIKINGEFIPKESKKGVIFPFNFGIGGIS